MDAKISFEGYESIIKCMTTYFREYGILTRAPDNYVDTSIVPSTLVHSYSNVCYTWDNFMIRYVEALEQGPGVGDPSYSPVIAACVGLSAAMGAKCDVFTLSTIANVSVVMSSSHTRGIVYPLALGGRRISAIPENNPNLADLSSVNLVDFPGIVSDDSIFRDRAGKNEFPPWIHALARKCMNESQIPLIILDPRIMRVVDDGVIIDGLPGNFVTMCSSVTAWFWWLAAMSLTKANAVAKLAQSTLDEALMFYYGGNAWEMVGCELLRTAKVRPLPLQIESALRLVPTVAHTKQMAVVMREYVLHGRTIEDIINARRDRDGKPVDRTQRSGPKDFFTKTEVCGLPRGFGKQRTHPSIDPSWDKLREDIQREDA